MKSSTPEGIDLTYELSTREKICSNMMLRDPYEKQMVEVKTSNAEDAGDDNDAADYWWCWRC